MSSENQAPVIAVRTVRQTVTPGMVEIFAGQRPSKNKTVDAANRVRSILVPELTVPDGVPSKFARVVLAALYDAARAQLAAAWEQNPALQEVSASAYTIDGLLAFAAVQAESRRLTSETITAHVLSGFLPTVAEAGRETAKAILLSMAAPTKGGKTSAQVSKLADKLEAWLTADEAANEGEETKMQIVGKQLLTKLRERAEELAAQETQVTIDSF